MIKKDVRETIKNMVKQKELFTSVDVANTIKNKGIWISNREVSSQMKELFSKTYKRYTVSNIVVKNAETGQDVTALLYHPKTKDSSEYNNHNAKPITPDEFDDIVKNLNTVKIIINNKNNTMKPIQALNKIKDTIKTKIQKDDNISSKPDNQSINQSAKRDYSKFNFPK